MKPFRPTPVVEGALTSLPLPKPLNKEYDMKVSNNQKPSEADDGVSRETLNDWQRNDAKKQRTEEATRGKKSENEASRPRASGCG
jgi:hypothetical protein